MDAFCERQGGRHGASDTDPRNRPQREHLLHLYVSNLLAQQSPSQRVNIMARSVHLVRLFDILLWRRSFISRRPSVLKLS